MQSTLLNMAFYFSLLVFRVHHKSSVYPGVQDSLRLPHAQFIDSVEIRTVSYHASM